MPRADAYTGKKPGEVKMIKRDDNVEAYQVRYCAPSIGTDWWLSGVWRPQWDSGSGTWQKVGEVVDAVGSSRKQLYQGRDYDYVFDVDVQEGVPPLKLPYNVNGEPARMKHAVFIAHFLSQRTHTMPHRGSSRTTTCL